MSPCQVACPLCDLCCDSAAASGRRFSAGPSPACAMPTVPYNGAESAQSPWAVAAGTAQPQVSFAAAQAGSAASGSGGAHPGVLAGLTPPGPPPGRPPPKLTPPKEGDWYALWQWESEKHIWIDYEPDFMHVLEHYWKQDTRKLLEFKPKGNVVFHYDVTEGWQMNTRSSTRRALRRVLMDPRDWDKLDALHSSVEEWNTQNADARRGMAARGTRSRSGSRARSGTPRPEHHRR